MSQSMANESLLWSARKTLIGLWPRGFSKIKSGNTYFRTFSTIIGPESLTAVFGMGTGVSFQV